MKDAVDRTIASVVLLSLVCVAFASRSPHQGSGRIKSDTESIGIDPALVAHRSQNMKVLDWEARIFLFEKFLTAEEADHIREASERRLARSGVVNNDGSSRVSDIRTSSGTFLRRGEDEVVHRVEERIAHWTLLPVEHGEGLQVLKYEKEQKYDAHWDYFFHRNGITNGGNRYATVLMYLTDVEEGGETVFPNIPAPGGENPGFSDCARYHLAARPRKGDAILFHSIQPNGGLERRSLHTACPVIKGVKWSAAKWIHVGHYADGTDGETPQLIEQTINPMGRRDPHSCDDLNELCPEWSRSGECKRNPVFMIGTRARPGQCLLSCGRCDLVVHTGAEAEQQRRRREEDDSVV